MRLLDAVNTAYEYQGFWGSFWDIIWWFLWVFFFVVYLFALFAVGAFHIIRKTNDPFVRIASGAITIWIVGQALINIGVVLRLLPVLGVPLPFMSQGGTSLLSVLIASGVLLSFARSLPAKRLIAPARPVRTR